MIPRFAVVVRGSSARRAWVPGSQPARRAKAEGSVLVGAYPPMAPWCGEDLAAVAIVRRRDQRQSEGEAVVLVEALNYATTSPFSARGEQVVLLAGTRVAGESGRRILRATCGLARFWYVRGGWCPLRTSWRK